MLLRQSRPKTEAIGRLVSLALRSGVKVDKIVDQATVKEAYLDMFI